MEKGILKENLNLVDEVAGVIVKLAGNLQSAESLIRCRADLEKEYKPGALYWSAGDCIDILQRLQIARAAIENEIDAVNYRESIGG